MANESGGELGPVERFSVAVAGAINERPLPKRLQFGVLDRITSRWVYRGIAGGSIARDSTRPARCSLHGAPC
jgi:hypothetical protein